MMAADFVPTRALDVEVSEPLPSIQPSLTTTGVPFGRARILVRLHTWPIGFVDLDYASDGISADSLATAVETKLGAAIRAHLARDSADANFILGSGGLPGNEQAACLETRRETLGAARLVSVVVPTVDRPDSLRRCLRDLLDQTYPNFEILVVDNAPGHSGAKLVVSSLETDGLLLRYLVEPRRGASRARNRGLEAARGEIVAFVDGDVRVDRSWLAALVTAISGPADGGSPVSCVTGAILPADLETQAQGWMEEWGGYFKGFDRRTFDNGAHRADSPLYPYAAAVFGSGAGMAFISRDLRDLGGFDLALGGGTPSRSGEDLAAFLDVVASGRTLVYEPGAIVWHHHPATERQFRSTLRSYGFGLTSYILRHATRHPWDALKIASAIPAALGYFFRHDSAHNAGRSPSFPDGLWKDEIAGMLCGPFAYALGRIRSRRS